MPILRQFFYPLIEKKKAVLLVIFTCGAIISFLYGGRSSSFQTIARVLSFQIVMEEFEWWAVLYRFALFSGLFFLLPLVLKKRLVDGKLSDLGWGVGESKLGFLVMVPLGLLVLAFPSGLVASFGEDFRAEYPLAKLATSSLGRFCLYQSCYLILYYVPYELFFRGYFQGGLVASLGVPSAVLMQTAVTALYHIGKPCGEIWAALAIGPVFGLLAIRLRSVWPLVIVHWGVGLATDIGCALASGTFLP